MVVIVDYQLGNVGSIRNMLKHIGVPVEISSDPADILAASRLILPGVGAFDHGMQRLREMGLVGCLEQKVLQQRTPILGICLGMQLFTRGSEEGTAEGLGWIDATTKRFDLSHAQTPIKIPHMGWNYVESRQDHPLLAELVSPRFYFVHSYHVCCQDPANLLAVADYGYEFVAAICQGNILGTQFHPEKSHRFGIALLENFVRRFGDVSSQSDAVPAAEGRRAS